MAQLEKAFSYDTTGNPVLVIYKRPAVTKTFNTERQKVEGYVIDFNDIWMFSRDHYPALVRCFMGFESNGMPIADYRKLTYDEAMMAKCAELCHQFDLGMVTVQKMADIASMIEEGIDELVSMPPQTPPEKHAIGEAKVTMRDKDGSVEKIFDVS